MNEPSLLNFNPDKLDMLLSWFDDEGLNYEPDEIDYITRMYNTNYIQHYSMPLIRARLAWSLIKSGIIYNHGVFAYIDKKYAYVGTLESMLTFMSYLMFGVH